jgi:CheY-like chemotaxis protein
VPYALSAVRIEALPAVLHTPLSSASSPPPLGANLHLWGHVSLALVCDKERHMRRTDESIDVRSEDPIRVVLAEDNAEFRLGLKEMLATDGGIEVVAEAENGAQAVTLAREVRPDVIVLDLLMPVMEGTEALGLILRDVSPPPGNVILTIHDQPHLRRELMSKGASAFLAKSASLAEVIGAVKRSRPMRTPREDSGEAPPAS